MVCLDFRRVAPVTVISGLSSTVTGDECAKPRWVWGPFWLFLMVKNQAGLKKDFS